MVGGGGETVARIKRVAREKEWARKDDDDDDDDHRAKRIEEDGRGAEGAVTRSRGIVNCGACTARLLVTVTVHLHSDLLNNAGIILRGKKKEVHWEAEATKSTGRRFHALIRSRVYAFILGRNLCVTLARE